MRAVIPSGEDVAEKKVDGIALLEDFHKMLDAVAQQFQVDCGGLKTATEAKLAEEKQKDAQAKQKAAAVAAAPAPAAAGGGGSAAMDLDGGFELDAEDEGVQELLRDADVNVADKPKVKRLLDALTARAKRVKRSG